VIPVIGVVVPTLGRRPNQLKGTLSALYSDEVFVVLVAPENADIDWVASEGLVHRIVRRTESSGDLAASINAGFAELPTEVKFVTWVNDDDLVSCDSLRAGSRLLSRFKDSPFVYGTCTYVNDSGKRLWTNRSGTYVRVLQRFGPNLMPQPGTLIRRSSLLEVGGLDETLHLAFDLDLFLRLQSLGRPRFSREVTALVRWDPTSLSSMYRDKQVEEGSRSRLNHAPQLVAPLLMLLEPITRRLTIIGPSVLLR
jgi:GT2 family glycosyltransferase